MDQDVVKDHKHAKKERGQYPAILSEQVWSIKDLNGKRKLISCKTQPAILGGKENTILPIGVASHSTGFLLTELVM